VTSRQDFVRQLANVEFTRATPELAPHLLTLFDDSSIDWQDLARPVASILLQEDADEALLHAYLRQCINTSYALERRFIAMCRDALRDRARSAPLLASLAIQAFHNGYVWPMRDEEFAALRSGTERESVRRVLVDEPAEEERLAATLTDEVPGDPITAAVRAQYEEHPYPRWLSLHRPAIVDLKERRILVAGCGTGRDAITLALRHPAATIDAVDISRRSLGYAMRKARELGAKNIRFRLADLRQLDGSYDAIHANGVIHHLADPVEGLWSLRTMLNDGGEIVAAIYSRRGRASLARLRALGGDGTDLRAARERIFAALDERERAELEDLDFFDLAHFRDTLYHAHQVELTPLELDAIIRDAGLVSIDDDLAKLDAEEAANPDLFRNMFRVRLRVT
jgi:2-polyprenyl-3-methyl-5-hydroxy-6-metoxy-1,4-benzoquinol methylase